MSVEMRRTGIEVLGDMPWGTHFCVFYETKADILEALVPYCKAGLENQEFCLWAVADPLRKEEATDALRQAVPDLARYSDEQSIEIVSAREWYLKDGAFDLNRVIEGWNKKLAQASARGYAGVRVTGDTAWLEKKDWRDFVEYEHSLNGLIADQRLAVLCTYPLSACGGSEVLDVVRTHQFAVVKRRGSWDVIETAGHKQAKAEIKRLNDELENRVAERTSQLSVLNEELRKEVLEHRCTERALRRSEAWLAEAQRLTRTGSFVWDISSRKAVYLSEEWYRIFGFAPEKDKNAWEERWERVHPDDRGRWQTAIEQALKDTSDYELEERLVLPDGSVKYLHIIGHPVTNTSGDVEQFMGSVTDISDRKRAEHEHERLRQLEADLAHLNRVSMMGELAASLSHELKQPIAAAITNAKTGLLWISRDQPDLEEAGYAIQRIVQDATRAAEIIDHLRSFYTKASPPEREWVDVNDILREMLALLRTEAHRNSISMRTVLDSHLPNVRVDRVQLKQVLLNLMLNGIEAMQDTAGELAIRSQVDQNDRVLISISDTGVGLPPGKADQIFQPFVTTKPQGSGMGLALSRSIVESHGGRLWASNNSGRGATFRFTLPTRAAKAMELPATGT
jgi:PAS domain S-box-containing protein